MMAFNVNYVRALLGDLPPHNRAMAIRRLEVLQEFWRRDRERHGRQRCKTRAEFVKWWNQADPSFSVSVKQVERWETQFRRRGVAGLCGVPGMARVRVRDLDELLGMPIGALVSYAADVLSIVASRLNKPTKGRRV